MRKKILIGILIFLVIFFVSIYVILRSSYTLGKIRSIAESIAQDQLKREVSIGEISGNIFSKIIIRNIAVARYDEISKGKLIDIESVEVDYSLHNLVRLRLDVDQININNPNIWVEMDKDGKLSIPEIPQQEKEAKPSRFKLLLADIRLNNGSLSFDDKKDDASLIINEINGKITGDKDNNFAGNIMASKGQVNLQKVKKSLSNINAEFAMEGNKIILSMAGLNIEKSSLKAKGEVLNDKNPKINMDAIFNIVLGDFKDFTPQIERLDGALIAKANINGELPNIAGVFNINGDSLSINDLNITKLDGKASFSTEKLAIQNISANIGNGKFDLTGSAELANNRLSKFDGELRLTNLDINRIATDFSKTEVPLNGILDGHLSVSGTEAKPGKINGKGNFDVANVTAIIPINKTQEDGRVITEQKIVTVGKINSLLNLDGNDISLDVSRGQTKMKVDGKFTDNAGFNLKMNLDGLQLSELSDIATGSPIADGIIKVNANASMKIVNPEYLSLMGLKDTGQKGKIIKDIADIKGNIKIDVPNISILANKEDKEEYTQVASLEGAFILNDDRINTDNFVIKLDEGECRLIADVKIEEIPYLKANISLDSIGIENYARIFGGDVPVRGGIINGQVDITGKTDDINGKGEIFIHDLAVSTRNINPIIIPIRIKSNTLQIPDLLIASDDEKINIALEFNPNGNYDLSVNSSPFEILGLYEDVIALQDKEIPSSEINKIPKPGGSLQISLAGKGNIKNPSLNGKISMKGLRFNGEVFGDGECLIDVGNNKAKVDVYLFDRTLTANLVSDIKEPFPFNAELLMNNINVEPALRLAKASDIIDLNITGNIKAHGEGKNPMDVSVEGILQSIILTADKYKWNNKSPIELNLKDRIFELNNFQMEGDGAKIEANANAKITGSGKNQKVELSADANIADIDLAVISDILDFPTPLSGNVNFNMNIEGGLDSPNVLVKIESPGIKYDQFDIDRVSGAITYKEGLIEIERFLVNAFDGEANIKFAMPFDIKTDASLTPEQIMEKNMRFSLDVKDINLAKFEELSPDIESLKGKVKSINLNAMGSIKQPRINGSVNLIDGFVKIKDVPIPIDNLNGQITLQNSKEKVNDDLYELSDNEYDTAVDFEWNMDKGNFGVNGIVRTPRDFVEYIVKLYNEVLNPASPILESGNESEYSQNVNEDEHLQNIDSDKINTDMDKPKANPFVEKFISIIKKPLPDLAYPELNFDVKMENMEVSPWIKGMVKDMEIPMEGDVSGNIHIEGEIYNPKGNISINPVRLILNDQEIRNPEPINIDIADRIIDISSFNLNFKPSTDNKIGTVVIKGNVNIDEQTYNFSCDGNDLHPSLATFLLETPSNDTEQDKPQTSVTISDGKIGFSISSEGKFNSPTAKITADVSNIVIPVEDKSTSKGNAKEAKIDKVLCNLSYNDGMFNIEQVNINTFGNNMNIKGKIPVNISLLPTKVDFPDKEMDVDLVMDNFGLEFLNTLIDNIQDFKGNAQANIKVFGTVNDPKLSGHLSMKNAKCTVLAVTTPSQKETTKPAKTTIDIEKINLKVVMDSEKVALDDASFSIGEGNYKADGSLKLGNKLEPQDFEFTFKTEPAKLNPFVELGGEEIVSRLSGDIKASGNLKGDIRDFKDKSILDIAKSLTGSMNIDPEGINILASGHRITNPRRVYAELKKGRLNLPSFKIMDVTSKESDATSISALGMWEIGGDKSFDLTAIINGKLITDLIDQPDVTMQGSLGFKLEARDDEINVFWPPRGNEESSRFTFQNASIDEFRGELKYKNQNIDINQIWLAMGENKVSISGFVPLNDKQMSLQMDARMNDMSILTLVNKEISESSGKITLGATVTGNLKKVITNEEPLEYVGSCLIENLNANLERAFVNFEDINADISFNSKSISAVEFNELSGKMNDGDFFLNSIHKPGVGIKWSKELGYRIGEFRNITLSMKDCTVFQPQVYSIVFDADPIQLRGDYDNPKLTGNVTVKEGLYNESLQSLIQSVLSSRQIGVKAFLDYPIVKNLVLDVNLIHGNMRMDNGIIDADAEIVTARVTGSLADPIVRTSGRITQGKFTYLNRVFNIKKGEFTNDGPINPQYDIVAETELSNDQASTGSNIKIQMQIKGSLTERYPPEFSILGGGGAAQETPDLSQNQIAAIIALGISPDQSLSRAFSSSSPLLVEPAKQYFESQAEKMLRLKEFKMQVDPRNPRETRLAAAKQLTKDISVTFDVGYGGQQWFGIQRDLLKNIALAGKISQEGDWGFDLKVEREFK